MDSFVSLASPKPAPTVDCIPGSGSPKEKEFALEVIVNEPLMPRPVTRPVRELVCPCGITFEPQPWHDPDADEPLCDECSPGSMKPPTSWPSTNSLRRHAAPRRSSLAGSRPGSGTPSPSIDEAPGSHAPTGQSFPCTRRGTAPCTGARRCHAPARALPATNRGRHPRTHRAERRSQRVRAWQRPYGAGAVASATYSSANPTDSWMRCRPVLRVKFPVWHRGGK
jgi:hypothetical protein